MTELWQAYCDGASRGNPGPASFGVVLVSPDGSVAKEISEAIGVNTNSVAEYEGLIRSLEELRAAGARRVRVVMDSEFIVKQFNGVYKVRDERMKVLMARVRALASGFEGVEVVHVRRSSHPFNTRADKLANAALDRQKKAQAPNAGG